MLFIGVIAIGTKKTCHRDVFKSNKEIVMGSEYRDFFENFFREGSLSDKEKNKYLDTRSIKKK